VGDQFAQFLQTLLPGLDWDVAGRAQLAEVLTTAAQASGGEAPGDDVYVLYRDDLPPGEFLPRALLDGFGAEEGDEVVEVRPAGRAGEMTARRWRITSALATRLDSEKQLLL
jgi:hypothetical protein